MEERARRLRLRSALVTAATVTAMGIGAGRPITGELLRLRRLTMDFPIRPSRGTRIPAFGDRHRRPDPRFLRRLKTLPAPRRPRPRSQAQI